MLKGRNVPKYIGTCIEIWPFKIEKARLLTILKSTGYIENTVLPFRASKDLTHG